VRSQHTHLRLASQSGGFAPDARRPHYLLLAFDAGSSLFDLPL
jgi:hypothetical protein